MRFAWLFSLSVAVVLSPGWVGAQSIEDETVLESAQVLREVMSIPGKAIPESLLADAQAIAIVPGMLKGGFVVGLRHGHGVLVVRDDSGAWRAPAFISVTGGSVGWQAGLQATDLVLVFKTRGSVTGLLRGKFTIGADASVAAGPVGRQASAGTDTQLKAEILSYSRSRGLFAGVAVDGAVLHVDQRAGAAYYAARPGQQPTIPASAIKLLEAVAQYTSPPVKVPVGKAPVAVAIPKEAPPPPMPMVVDERELVRRDLAGASQRLLSVVDQRWQQFLALPAEVYTGQAAPPPEALEQTARRYDTVAGDARYRALTERREFQETHALLNRYTSLHQPRPMGVIKLPPPPGK
jgi:lipid-binding SYLF domain-containing protein